MPILERLELLSEGIVQLVLQLEGPYKLYAIGVIAIILTALVTSYIFKTLKWFVLFFAIVVLLLSVFMLFTSA